MKIICKTLYLETFRIEAKENETMKQLKQKIHSVKGIPIACQRLMCSGKLLSDKETVADLTLNSETCLVVMVSSCDQKKTAASESKKTKIAKEKADARNPKKKPEPNQKRFDFRSLSSKQKPANSFADQAIRSCLEGEQIDITDHEVTDKQEEQPKEEKVQAVPVPIPDKQLKKQQEKNTFVEGDTILCYQNVGGEARKKLLEMGFSLEKVTTALAAANNDPDKAVDILLEVFVPVSSRNEKPIAEDQTIKPTKNLTNDERLEVLLGDPSIRALRRLIVENPEIITDIAEFIKEEHPDLARTLVKNPIRFLKKLKEEDGEQKVENPAVNRQVEKVRWEEKHRRAIENLKAMGFSDESVQKAYKASGKNEQIAAEILLDQK